MPSHSGVARPRKSSTCRELGLSEVERSRNRENLSKNRETGGGMSHRKNEKQISWKGESTKKDNVNSVSKDG